MKDLSISDITALLERYGLSPLKKLGQNFLTDANVVRRIADAAGIDGANVIEIGPGLGSLTGQLASRAKKTVCVELDGGMVRVLSDRFVDEKNVVIVNGDILKTDLDALAKEHFGEEPFVVCGNLPYYITAKTILHICGSKAKSMTVMVQREVAERLAAEPGSRDYGSITASVAYFTVPSLLFTVSKNCFYPAPEVESAVIRADLDARAVDADREKYVKTVRAAFAQRRKTIYNNLCSAFSKEIPKSRVEEILDACGIKKETRAESLSPDDFAKLSGELFR